MSEGFLFFTCVRFWPKSLPAGEPVFSQKLGPRIQYPMDLLIAELPAQATFSLVANVVNSEQGILECTGISPYQVFRVSNAPSLTPGLYTFYDLLRSEEDGPCCQCGELTAIMPHLPKGDFQQVTIMDLCSGMGGFSIASQMIGMPTVAFVEKSQLACDALRANFTCPVIQGDLGDMATLKQAHAARGNGFLQVTGGFPCQGFSLQGDQMGMNDHRSHSLCYILHAAWLLQADDVLLECVANVINFRQAQDYIDCFAATANMHATKLIFDLQAQWPVRRNRFWCHLMKKDQPNMHIPSWPKSQCFRTLGTIMPLDALWSEADEQQLEWDPSELAIYLDSAFGDDQRLLQEHGQAPTVLHSWAHINRPCPCGCRGAFCLARLRSGGARGFGLLSSRSGKYRHLHPEEGALLCTVPPGYQFPMPARSALSLLGQIAAPMQVLWVQAHILSGLQMHHWGWTGIDPMRMIQALQDFLRSYAFTKWTTPSMYVPRHIQLQIEGQHFIHEIKVDTPIRVADLVLAEKRLGGWGHYVVLKFQGQRLPMDTCLVPNVIYTIEYRTCKQLKPFPQPTGLLGGGSPGIDTLLGDRLLWTFMQRLILCSDVSTHHGLPFLMYPFSVVQFLQMDLPIAVTQSWHRRWSLDQGDIFLICELHGHWILLHGRWISGQQGLHWTVHDGLLMSQSFPWCLQLTMKFTHALQLQHLGLTTGLSIAQVQPHTCGTIALLHLAQRLQLLDQVRSDEVLALHNWLLQWQEPGSYLVGGGLPADYHAKLVRLLIEHGVPADRATDRANLVIQKLGPASIQEAFVARNCWAYLKAIASKPSIAMRLVQPDELSKHIESTASSTFGAKVTNAKSKKTKSDKKQPVPPLTLDPAQLTLHHTYFKDTEDDVVSQIDFADVEAEAHGVAICTLAQGHHFLQSQDSISSNPLAILTTERPAAALMEQFDIQPIVFAAKYQGTGEPVLIYGALKNLGDLRVRQHVPGNTEAPSLINTQVIKVQIFRDEFTGSWSQLAQAPVRTLCQEVPLLQLCSGKDCGTGCPKSHAAVDEELDTILLEIWARSFSKIEGGKVAAADAHTFSVFLRIPESILESLLQCGVVGIYFEPRSSMTKSHDERYRVVWLPSRTLDEAQHVCHYSPCPGPGAHEAQIWHSSASGT